MDVWNKSSRSWNGSIMRARPGLKCRQHNFTFCCIYEHVLSFFPGRGPGGSLQTHAGIRTILELDPQSHSISVADFPVAYWHCVCIHKRLTVQTRLQQLRYSLAWLFFPPPPPFVVIKEPEYAICYIITTELERVDGAKSWVMTLLFLHCYGGIIWPAMRVSNAPFFAPPPLTHTVVTPGSGELLTPQLLQSAAGSRDCVGRLPVSLP